MFYNILGVLERTSVTRLVEMTAQRLRNQALLLGSNPFGSWLDLVKCLDNGISIPFRLHALEQRSQHLPRAFSRYVFRQVTCGRIPIRVLGRYQLDKPRANVY